MSVSFALVDGSWRRANLSKDKKKIVRSTLERHGRGRCVDLSSLNVKSVEAVDGANKVVCLFWDVEIEFFCDPDAGRVTVKRLGYLNKFHRYAFYAAAPRVLDQKFVPVKDFSRLG